MAANNRVFSFQVWMSAILCRMCCIINHWLFLPKSKKKNTSFSQRFIFIHSPVLSAEITFDLLARTSAENILSVCAGHTYHGFVSSPGCTQEDLKESAVPVISLLTLLSCLSSTKIFLHRMLEIGNLTPACAWSISDCSWGFLSLFPPNQAPGHGNYTALHTRP